MDNGGQRRCICLAIALSLSLIARVAIAEDDYSYTDVPVSIEGAEGDVQQVTIIGQRSHVIDDGPLESYFQTGLDNGPGGIGSENGGKSPGLPANKAQEPGKTNNNSPTPCGNSQGDPGSSSPTGGNPVVLSSGEKVEYETDWISPKLYGLSMQRGYRAFSNSHGILGLDWTSNYDYTFQKFYCYSNPDYPGQCIPQYVKILFPDGSNYTFNPTFAGDTTYHAVGSGVGTLNWNGPNGTNSWALQLLDTTYNFDNNGVIQRVLRNSVAILAFHYTNGVLTSVTNPVGDSISIAHANGNTQITDPNGAVWNYGTSTGILTSVASPGPQAHTRTYQYENAALPYSLTGITVDNVRLSTYSYYTNGQVHVSSRAGNEISDTFTYGGGTTTQATVSGESTAYTFVNVLGQLQ